MKNTLIWTSDKNNIYSFEIKESHIFHLFESNVSTTEFRKVAKKMKEYDCDRILKIENDLSFEMIYKKNSVWSSVKFDDLITNWMLYKNISPLSSEGKVPKIFSNGKKSKKIEFPYKINKTNAVDYKEIIDFFLEDGSLSKISGIDDKSYSTINTKFNVSDREYFDKTLKLISNTKPKGLNFVSSKIINDDKFELQTKYGEVLVAIDSYNNVEISGVLSSEQKDIADLFSFSRAININITNYIKNNVETLQSIKASKKNIATWTLSIIILFTLAWITFGLILDPSNTGMAIKVMFSGYTLMHGWIYLLWINFFISLFIIPIVAIIFIKASDPKRKISYKQQMNIFISAQIRLATVFLTGNALLATVVWGWYLNTTRGVKVVGFVGMVVSINIIRGILLLPVGAAFMIRGTIFNHTILSEAGLLDSYYAFVTLSWIGWLWHIFENLAITLLIVLPPLHILYNKFLFIRYRNVKNSNVMLDKFTTFEMNLVNLKHSFKNIFNDKARLGRTTVVMIAVIFIETFEFTFGLRVVEDYAFHESFIPSTAKYLNVFAISGVRYMSSFVRHVPIINLIPGQGLGVTELVLSNYTYGVINHAHGNGSLTVKEVTDLSEQTTFVMRFFNFYLKRIIALITCMIVIPKAIHNKNSQNKAENK